MTGILFTREGRTVRAERYTQGESPVKTEAETGVVGPEAKECQNPLEAQNRQKEGFSPSVSWGKGKMACFGVGYILLPVAPQNEQTIIWKHLLCYICVLFVSNSICLVSGFCGTVT